MSIGKCFLRADLNLKKKSLVLATYSSAQYSLNVSSIRWFTTQIVVSSAIAYPHEVLRSRQQDSRLFDGRSSRLRDVIGDAIRREGPLSLYSGFTTNLMRIMPHYAIVFVLYEQLSYSFSEIIDWPRAD